ncbi:MAG: cupin domain-containing protein [Pseudomonadota bacterium]
MTADEVIARLALKPHPEGGHYAETFRDDAMRDRRPASTAIYYLLKRGERSHWHRIDVVEIWHYYAGDPLRLEIADDAGAHEMILGRDIAKGERPQGVVPARAFQAAQSLGEWTLVGCTVAPGFDFSRFELAPIGWSPEFSR